jgi:hypothetical protein
LPETVFNLLDVDHRVPSLGLAQKLSFVKIKPWNLKKLRDRAEAKVGSFFSVVDNLSK